MSQRERPRRRMLAVFGVGATVGLAGCSSILEPDDSQTTDSEDGDRPAENNDSTEPEQLDIEFRSVKDADLSDVYTKNRDPGSYPLEFSADTAELEADLQIKLTNGIQSQVYEASTSDLRIEGEISVLDLPEELLVHGDSRLTVSLSGSKKEKEFETRFKTKTPSGFKIARRVEGDQVLTYTTPWAFAQHNLNRDEARQSHLEYINQDYVSEGYVRQPIVDGSLYEEINRLDNDYEERLNRIEELNPEEDMLELLEVAGDIAADLEHDVPTSGPTGTQQSGHRIGHGAAQIIRDLHNTDLRTFVIPSPDYSLIDSILQYNPITDNVIFQGYNGTTRSMERGLGAIERNKDSPYNKATIYMFQPGKVEEYKYDRKSWSAAYSLITPVVTREHPGMPINDYAIEILSQEYLLGDKDTQKLFDILSSVAEIQEMVNYDLSGEKLYDVENGRVDPLEANYVGIAADPEDSVEDMTVFATSNKGVYNDIFSNPEPSSKSKIMSEL